MVFFLGLSVCLHCICTQIYAPLPECISLPQLPVYLPTNWYICHLDTTCTCNNFSPLTVFPACLPVCSLSTCGFSVSVSIPLYQTMSFFFLSFFFSWSVRPQVSLSVFQYVSQCLLVPVVSLSFCVQPLQADSTTNRHKLIICRMKSS